MISQRHILILLNALAVIVTVLAVLGAFTALTGAIADNGSSMALRWACGVMAVLLAVNVILLVAALGMREMQRDNTFVGADPPSEEQLEVDEEIDLERERRLGG